MSEPCLCVLSVFVVKFSVGGRRLASQVDAAIPSLLFGHRLFAQRRASELKPDRSLVGSVRDYRFELLQIGVWVYLHDPEMIDVRLGGDPLHSVRLDVFNRDHIFSLVLEPANNDEFAEYTGSRSYSGLGV